MRAVGNIDKTIRYPSGSISHPSRKQQKKVFNFESKFIHDEKW